MKQVPKCLPVKSSVYVAIGDEQAKQFARSIFAGVKEYIQGHRAEFDAWQAEQEAGEKLQ